MPMTLIPESMITLYLFVQTVQVALRLKAWILCYRGNLYSILSKEADRLSRTEKSIIRASTASFN